MSRIAIISKYFGYNIGGAERSLFEMMKNEEMKGHKIVTVRVKNLRTYQAEKFSIEFPNSWEVHNVKVPLDIMRFRFLEYFINRRCLISVLKKMRDIDVLYAYGLYAPALINIFNGESVYTVRDEYGLGWNINYYKGIRNLIQSGYHLIEWPLRVIWKQELLKAIRKSRLIANSRFIAQELTKIAPTAKVDVIYPQINEGKLKTSFNYHRNQVTYKGIVAVGDNVLKGGDLVKKVAKLMPNENFYLFDRRYRTPIKLGNLHLMPWQEAGRVYAIAKLVMVPSRWHEAFSRVALEATILGIPIVASNRGGIPEALNYNKQLLIEDIENPNLWIEFIQRTLALKTDHYLS